MNPGGVRADLAPGPGGVVTFEQLHAVQPFRNAVVTMTLTGAQIVALLEAQFQMPRRRMLQPSAGLTYTYDPAAPSGARVYEVRLEGRGLAPKARVRVTVNGFLAQGGDGFSVFEQGTEVEEGPLDLDALVAYFAAHNPVRAPAMGRMRRVAHTPPERRTPSR
jgi:5'-nucleotidase